MLFPELEERVRSAKLALDKAASENIIELCQRYLALLNDYRAEFYELHDELVLNPSLESSSRAAVQTTRTEVRTAIEQTIQERNRIEALLLSFTAVSAYGAVETFNQQKYQGRADWRLDAGGVSFSDGAGGQRMTIQGAVETASLLRREEYVSKNACLLN